MGSASKAVLKKALTIQKIILHVFEEESEKKQVEKLKRQIKETEKVINNEKKE